MYIYIYIYIYILYGKITYGVVSHLLNVCKSASCKTEYLQVKLIEHVFVREGEDGFMKKGKILPSPTLYFNT